MPNDDPAMRMSASTSFSFLRLIGRDAVTISLNNLGGAFTDELRWRFPHLLSMSSPVSQFLFQTFPFLTEVDDAGSGSRTTASPTTTCAAFETVPRSLDL